MVTAGSAVAYAAARRAPGAFFAAGVLWTGLLIGLAAILGVGVAIGDQPPHDPLHLVYGVLAMGTLPGAAIVASGRTGRDRATVWAIAGIVSVILILRLFQTAG